MSFQSHTLSTYAQYRQQQKPIQKYMEDVKKGLK